MNRIDQMTNIQLQIINILTNQLDKYLITYNNNNLPNILSSLYNNIKESLEISKNKIQLINLDYIIKNILYDININIGIHLIKKQNIIYEFINLQKDGLELFKKKNTDYGDAFAEFGIIGILMRIGDKIQRYLTITKNKEILIVDEKVNDTLIDLYNYSVMGLMVIDFF
jgi:hypothetical protein